MATLGNSKDLWRHTRACQDILAEGRQEGREKGRELGHDEGRRLRGQRSYLAAAGTPLRVH